MSAPVAESVLDVCNIEQQVPKGQMREGGPAKRKVMHQNDANIRIKSGGRAVKSIANWRKVTYNKWFCSELWSPG